VKFGVKIASNDGTKYGVKTRKEWPMINGWIGNHQIKWIIIGSNDLLLSLIMFTNIHCSKISSRIRSKKVIQSTKSLIIYKWKTTVKMIQNIWIGILEHWIQFTSGRIHEIQGNNKLGILISPFGFNNGKLFMPLLTIQIISLVVLIAIAIDHGQTANICGSKRIQMGAKI
jgi:hypothetical protein